MDILPTSGLVQLAYLDPGTGSIIIQIIVGGIAGIFVFMKYQGNRIRGWFSPKRDKGEAESEG